MVVDVFLIVFAVMIKLWIADADFNDSNCHITIS